MSTSKGSSPRGGSLLDRFGMRMYRAWFGFRDRTGAFRKSAYAEGVAASRFQSHRIYLHTIWREFCNIGRRIALLHTYRLHRCGIPLLTPSELRSSQYHQKCKLRRDRTKNMRTLLAIHPGATLIDLFLLTHLPHPSEGDCRKATEMRFVHQDEPQHIDSCNMQMGPDTKNFPRKSQP